jgi:hypothetical protein
MERMTDQSPTLLVTTLLEIERHVAVSGWDRPPLLYALVDTSDLVRREPALAAELGLDSPDVPANGLTPVEQDPLPDGPLEDALARIEWPPAVRGCALVQEVVTLPPEAEADMPDDDGAAYYAATHPLRQEIRLAVGVLRDGSRAAAARIRDQKPLADQEPATGQESQRNQPEDANLVVDADLAPALAEALLATLG